MGGKVGWGSPGLPCCEAAPKKPEESCGSQAQTCLHTVCSSGTDGEQPVGRMVPMQTQMTDLSGAAGVLDQSYPHSRQSVRLGHHRCSYFCFIELMILPERVTSLFFSYHVHALHDRRCYRSRSVSGLSHSHAGQIPMRKFTGSMLSSFIFYWNTVEVQCFRCTAKWFSHIYVYLYAQIFMYTFFFRVFSIIIVV